MPRRKNAQLGYITNDSVRKTTYKKRKKGLLKKLEELTILCDVKACAIIYSPIESEPTIFPTNDPLKALGIITDFQRLPEADQTRKMLNQEDFLKEKIIKANDKLKKVKTDNHDKRLTQIMYAHMVDRNKSFDDLSIWDLNDLNRLLDQQLKDINQRLKIFENEGHGPPLPPPVSAPALDQIPAVHQVRIGDDNHILGGQVNNASYFNNYNNNVIINNNYVETMNSLQEEQMFIDMMMNNNSHDGGVGTSNNINMPFDGNNPSFSVMPRPPNFFFK